MSCHCRTRRGRSGSGLPSCRHPKGQPSRSGNPSRGRFGKMVRPDFPFHCGADSRADLERRLPDCSSVAVRVRAVLARIRSAVRGSPQRCLRDTWSPFTSASGSGCGLAVSIPTSRVTCPSVRLTTKRTSRSAGGSCGEGGREAMTMREWRGLARDYGRHGRPRTLTISARGRGAP